MKRVCVVLSTYNVDKISNGQGVEYLRKLLDSLQRQKLNGYKMVVCARDDSRDSDVAYEILKEYQEKGLITKLLGGGGSRT